MNRLPSYTYAMAIEAALEIIPVALHPLLAHVDFLCGTDPVYAGLHAIVLTDDGRTYRETAHFVPEFNQDMLPKSRRRDTIVLPEQIEPWGIVHELGHALDRQIARLHGRPWYTNLPVHPVSDYARVDPMEAFAESFTCWLLWAPWHDQDVFYSDQATMALFESLRQGEFPREAC